MQDGNAQSTKALMSSMNNKQIFIILKTNYFLKFGFSTKVQKKIQELSEFNTFKGTVSVISNDSP